MSMNDPKKISAKGEEIYNKQYRQEFEREHDGKFVAINIQDGSATLGDSSGAALLKAKRDRPDGLFHLIRVGHAGAFEVGMAHKDVAADRLHR